MATETIESENFFRLSSFIIDGVDAISISLGPSINDLEKEKDIITECPICKTYPKFEIASSTELKYECECNSKLQSKVINIKEFLETFIQKKFSGQNCDNHQTTQSNSFCQTCNKFLCSECLNKHNVNQNNEGHEITQSFTQKKTICIYHPKEMAEFYCLTCKQHLCGNCATNHSGNNTGNNFFNSNSVNSSSNYHTKHSTIKLKEIIKENTFQNLYSIYLLGKKKIEENNKYLKERTIDKINSKINEQINILNEKKKEYIQKITLAYQRNREINQDLLKFYNLLLNHYSSNISNPSYNSIYNLQNIKINLDMCDYETLSDLETNYQKILKYFNENLVLQNGKVQFNNLQSLLENDYPSEMHCLNTVEICKDELILNDVSILTEKNDNDNSLVSLLPSLPLRNKNNQKRHKVTSVISLTNKQLLACLDTGDIFIYEYKNKIELIKTINAHNGRISSITILKNNLNKGSSNNLNSDNFNNSSSYLKNQTNSGKRNTYIMTSSDDCTIKIFDIENFKVIHTIKNFNDRIVKSFQLKDLNILSNSSNGKLCLFNGSSPYNCLLKLESPGFSSNFIELSDGRIAICGENTFQIISLNKFYGNDSKQNLGNNSNIIRNIPSEGPNPMIEISIKQILIGSKGKILIISIEKCTIEKRIEDSNLGVVLSMITLLDGSLLVGDNTGNLFRFNQTFHFMTMMEDCHTSGVNAMCLNHLGNVITCSEEIRHWNY